MEKLFVTDKEHAEHRHRCITESSRVSRPKAREDPVYFVVNQLGLRPYVWQAKFLDALVGGKNVLACTSRQIGKTSAVAWFALWACIYNTMPMPATKKTRIVIVSKTEAQALKVISDVREYMRIGDDRIFFLTGHKKQYKSWFSDQIAKGENTTNSKSVITFTNGCQIISLPPTDAARGYTGSILFIDEVAFIPDDVIRDVLLPIVSATGNRVACTSTPNGRCYDDKTEVLTQDGWKLFEDVEDDELVYSRNPLTGKAELVPILDRYEGHQDSDMFAVCSRNLDIMVTPNHRMVGYVQKSKKRTVLEAKDLAEKRTDFWVDLSFDVEKRFGVEKVVVPPATHKKARGEHTTDEWILDAKKFYRWFGFFLAEGHTSTTNGNWEVCLTQNPGETFEFYLALTKELFGDKANIFVKSHNDAKRIIINNKQLASYLKDFKQEASARDALPLSRSLCEEIWKGYWDGDGNVSENRQRVFVDAKYPGLADFLQMVATRTSGSARVLKSKENMLAVVRSKHKRSKIKTYENVEWRPYIGKIYCLTVKHGELYVRRNGKSYWCGNSGWFYKNFDPEDNLGENTYYRLWCPYDVIRQDDEARTEQKDKDKQLSIRLGEERSFLQEYEADFSSSESSFFGEEVDHCLDSRLENLQSYKEPCDMGIDFGKKVSRTVVTISALEKRGSDSFIRLVYQYEYGEEKGIGEDLVQDVAVLLKKYNVQRMVVEDCPQSAFFQQAAKLRGWPITIWQPSGEKNRQYNLLRSWMRQGRVRYPHLPELIKQMRGLVVVQLPTKERIEHGNGLRDDCIDSFVISTHHLTVESVGLRVWDLDTMEAIS